MGVESCPLCKRLDATGQYGMQTRQTSYVCKRCGSFVVEEGALSMPNGSSDEQLIPYLSSYTRRYQGDSSNPPVITHRNWKELL
jgi:hypothetical protein